MQMQKHDLNQYNGSCLKRGGCFFYPGISIACAYCPQIKNVPLLTAYAGGICIQTNVKKNRRHLPYVHMF